MVNNVQSDKNPFKKFKREDLKARYKLFEAYALEDQKKFYKGTVAKNRLAAKQVNQLRAIVALLTGLASAAAALIVQSSFINGAACASPEANGYCNNLQLLVSIFVIASITLPAFGAFFSTLADLYQWDRLITIYDAALENIEIADAQSPDETIDDELYRVALKAYAQGTLSVMSDEAAQWGQAIRTPQKIEESLKRADERSKEAIERNQRAYGIEPES